MKSITRLFGLFGSLFLLTAPSLAYAAVNATLVITTGNGGVACDPNDISGIGCTIIYLINNILIPVLFSIAFIVFLYGVFTKYILSNGNQETVDQGHKLILWGIIGFVVMISLWGLVNVVSNTLGLAGDGAPIFPQTPLTATGNY